MIAVNPQLFLHAFLFLKGVIGEDGEKRIETSKL